MTPPRGWLPHAVAMLLVVGLTVASHWSRSRHGPACAFDGASIEDRYRVRIVDDAGHERAFCCVRCAEDWLARQRNGHFQAWVTDEATGRQLDPARAFFVRSLVITNPTTANRIHVFGSRALAQRHCTTAGGTLLSPTDRPLRAADQRRPRDAS